MNTFGFRHVVVTFVTVGVIISYMLRVNLSVAILAMVNNTALDEMARAQQPMRNYSIWTNTSSTDACLVTNSTSVVRDGQFLWDAETRGTILGAFYYGYLATQMLGGWLAVRFGAKWIFAFGMLWTSVFTLLTPLTVQLDIPLLIAVRVLQGMGEGLAFPCITGILCQWITPRERTSLTVITSAGIGIGGMVGFPFSSSLCATEMGWPLVFYVSGAIGVLWVVFWCIFVTSTPKTNRWIGHDEREYVVDSLAGTIWADNEKNADDQNGCFSIPWLEIAKTPSVWALGLSFQSFTWGSYTVLSLLPTYFKNTLNMDLSSNGLYSALPFLTNVILSLISGFASDYIINRGLLSVRNLRKIMDGLAHVIPGVFLLLTTLIGCDVAAAVALMCVAVGFQGLTGAGAQTNLIDLTGKYAGLLYGIYSTLGAVGGILAPYVAGAITEYDDTVTGWRYVFAIAAAFYFVSTIVYTLFAQGETAWWAVSRRKPVENSDNLEPFAVEHTQKD